jgi:hypothetical protein
MQKPSAAASEVAELLNEAMSRGHVVVLRTSPPSHVDPRTPLLLALNHLFGLSPAESRGLVELLGHQQVSRQAMHVAVSADGTPVSRINVIDVIIYNMRRKLAPHDLKIVAVHGLGFKLAEGARDRIRRLLAEHSPELVLESSRAKPKNIDQHTE